MLASAVSSLEKPNSRVLRIFRDWFSGKTRCQPWPVIAGKAQTMLANKDDLVALHVGLEKDTLTRLVQDHWLLEVECLHPHHLRPFISPLTLHCHVGNAGNISK
jgi:hypothetical protein